MKQEFIKFLAIIAIVAVIICLILAALATIGAVKITDGCFYRYNFDASGRSTDVISKTVTLQAHGNYTATQTNAPGGKVITVLDPTKYGSWLNTNFEVKDGEELKYEVKGELSLCRGYIPSNNLQSTQNVDKDGKKIPIPRIEEVDKSPVSLYFDAKIDEWRNIAELYRNDQVNIMISPDRKNVSNAVFPDIFSGRTITANCSDGNTTYSPICGRYSIYKGMSFATGILANVFKGKYVKGCRWEESYYKCGRSCKCYDIAGADSPYVGDHCMGLNEICKDKYCGAYIQDYGDMPLPYKSDGTYTIAWSNNLSELIRTYWPACNEGPSKYIQKALPDGYLNSLYFWFSATDAAGLLYRISASGTPEKSRGIAYNFAQILSDQGIYADNLNYKMIYNSINVTSDLSYLQYRFISDDGKFADNTGGYILSIKQTKCRRTNGAAISDAGFANRGQIEYAVLPFGQDPNKAGTTIPEQGVMIPTGPDGGGSITPAHNGTLWVKILNHTNDYPDSVGTYSVHFKNSYPIGQFMNLILNPLFELKDRIREAGVQIFQNMTCYGQANTGTCTNFFSYVRALLMVYVAIYGIMFLIGMVQINQMNLIIEIIKIILVAGLLNEKTFIFFNNVVVPFVTNFSDIIIANIAGYSAYSINDGSNLNPMLFLDTLMSRLLFSKTFLGQLLALLSMGISGILYFILIFIAIIITIITLLRAVAIYLMAFTAIAVLLGIAPLFLTFILFNWTRYLFDNWVRFTIRYMMEPVILFAGIIVLVQLFTIYLDYAVGYSVCWKCALSFQIPFPTIPGLENLSNLDLFCLNWFAPWGFDHRSGMMGVNIQHIISLVIISYCLYGYTDLSGKMVAKLTQGIGGPSATAMGGAMSSAFEHKAQKSVGLDAQSRGQIKAGAKQRLKDRSEAIDKYKANLRKNPTTNNNQPPNNNT